MVAEVNVVDRGIEPLCQDWESCILTIRWIDRMLHSRQPDFPKRKEGDSNPRYKKYVRQFSKLLVSATHPSFQSGLANRVAKHIISNACAKVTVLFCSSKCFPIIFLWASVFSSAGIQLLIPYPILCRNKRTERFSCLIQKPFHKVMMRQV